MRAQRGGAHFMLGRDAQRPLSVPAHSRSMSSWMKRTPPVKAGLVLSQPKKFVGKL